MKILMTITGASGAGKDTLMNSLLQLSNADVIPQPGPLSNMFANLTFKKPLKMRALVSHTTRPKRSYEKDGESYYFVSPEVFDATPMAEVIRYASNSYGLSVKEITSIQDGEIGIVVVDPKGKRSIEKYLPAVDDIKHISVFVKTDPMSSMERMLMRGEKQTTIMERLRQQSMHREYSATSEYDLILPAAGIEEFPFNVLMVVNYLSELGV